MRTLETADNEALFRGLWQAYLKVFLQNHKIEVLFNLDNLLKNITVNKELDLISELSQESRDLFLKGLMTTVKDEKPALTWPPSNNQDQLKYIISKCAHNHLNELLAFLLRIGAGKCYSDDQLLENKHHPLYLCGQQNNAKGLELFLRFAEFIYHIRIKMSLGHWFLPGHDYMLIKKPELIKAIFDVNPALLDYPDGGGKNVAHHVFSGLRGDPYLRSCFEIIFSLRPDLFIKKNNFGQTAWDWQKMLHPEQTPEALLGKDCYSNPTYQAYLPPKPPVEAKPISPLLIQNGIHSPRRPKPVASTPPLCPGCLVM